MNSRPWLRLALLLALTSASIGCRSRWTVVDPRLAVAARQSLADGDFPQLEHDEEDPRKYEPGGTVGEAILGVTLAIFPGVIVHGVGHYYAGDYDTARKVNRIGQFGYLLGGIGAGLAAGGYFAGEEDLDGLS
ncbi:MAG: hypothetical protein AAF517_24220, partial [Planctomycetota bacterium]